MSDTQTGMVEVQYDALNDLVHEVADSIEAATGLQEIDRYELNDLLSSYLSSKNVLFTDEDFPSHEVEDDA